MKRYRILVAAVAMQMCLGATYAWSVFVLPLKQIAGLSQGTAQLPFSLFYFAFPATMIASGALLSRIGPRRCALLGGVLFGGGWLLASLGRFHFGFTLLGIGLLAGVGVGVAYIVPIATCLRWFPRQKGLVTGVAVAGFGGGAALVSQLAGQLMNEQGLTPFTAFGLLGSGFLLLVTLSGWTMENPPEHREAPGQAAVPAGMLRERAFLFLYLAMFTGLAAGFTVNANLKELFGDAAVAAGVRAVAVFALANAGGRIVWGWLYDRVRTLAILQANLLLQAALLMLHTAILRSEGGLVAFAAATGFNYGGILVLYASATAERWGRERFSRIYGRLFSANIPAAVAPFAAGAIFDGWGSFAPALWGLGILMLAGAGLLAASRGPCLEHDK